MGMLRSEGMNEGHALSRGIDVKGEKRQRIGLIVVLRLKASGTHGADHVLPLLAPPSLTVPVLGGRMALGTWQSICLLDPNADNATRTVRLSLLAG